MNSILAEVSLIDSTHVWPASGGLDDQDAALTKYYNLIHSFRIENEIDIMKAGTE